MAQSTTVPVAGAELRRIRIDQDRELQDVAAAAGITASYLSRLETGTRRRVSPKIFRLLRTYLGVTREALLDIEQREEATCPASPPSRPAPGTT